MSADMVSLRCRRCGMVLQTAGPRITEETLRALRQHLRAAHPAHAVPDEAPAGDVLKHFNVGQTP